jgi:hypothetical protein
MSNDFPQRMSEQFEHKVARTANGLRVLADRVEREGRVGENIRTMKPDHAYAAQSVIHAITWGMANLDLGGIVQCAKDADQAIWEDQ